MQLSAVDLNLVPLLHAALEEQNVARAARRVGLSPSAASHALGRLREVLGDPLLVRSGRRLVRTPRAEALLPSVQRAVRELEALIAPVAAEVDPRRLTRAFSILAADDVHLVLGRALDRRLARDAPGVDLRGLPLGPGYLDRLRDGADVAVSVAEQVPDEFERLPLYEDVLSPVARVGHPAGERLSVRRFAALSHVLVSPMGGPRGLVDELLEQRGLTRRVARTVPGFFEALVRVADGDEVTTVPARLVDAVGERLGLRRLTVPLAFPRFRFSLLWHRRWGADPEHTWFRSVIAAVGRVSEE